MALLLRRRTSDVGRGQMFAENSIELAGHRRILLRKMRARETIRSDAAPSRCELRYSTTPSVSVVPPIKGMIEW